MQACDKDFHDILDDDEVHIEKWAISINNREVWTNIIVFGEKQPHFWIIMCFHSFINCTKFFVEVEQAQCCEKNRIWCIFKDLFVYLICIVFWKILIFNYVFSKVKIALICKQILSFFCNTWIKVVDSFFDTIIVKQFGCLKILCIDDTFGNDDAIVEKYWRTLCKLVDERNALRLLV